MNTFLLAAVALGLVAFLVIRRKRQAAAGAAADWGFDEMIVEPGWPMPGEIAGTWPGGAPAPEAPLAAPPVAVAEAEALDPRDDAIADEVTGEWTMPATTPYATQEPEPVADVLEDAPAYPDAEADADAGASMEAWVPGVSEAEPVASPEPEPEPELAPEPAPLAVVDPEPLPQAPAADPEPVLVWADPAPADEVAGPPAWRPEAAEEPAPVEAPAPVWEPEPEAAPEPALEAAPEPAPVAVDDPWQPVLEPAVAVVDADPADQADAVAEGLPLAVAALTPVLAAGDALGVTPRMAAVLRALADEPRGLPDLGRALGVSRPVVADVCARLEDLDLVWRERDPDDRRRMLVVPTPKGLKLAEEAVPGLDRDAVAGALDRLSPAERAALVSAVRVLREAAVG